jgi:hypothetical protein
VNGGRKEPAGDGLYDPVLDPVEIDIADIRRTLGTLLRAYPELAAHHNDHALIADLADQIALARTSRLDNLTYGTRTKPEEWKAQIVLAGVRAAMRRHGLKPAVWESERPHQLAQSWFVRMAPGLVRLAGLRAPKDIRGLCRRAKRIEVSSGP